MRKLRRFYTPEETAELYARSYDPGRWLEHTERIRRTVDLIPRYLPYYPLNRIADLSCGDGSLANMLPAESRFLADRSDGLGTIEERLSRWDEDWSIPSVDLFVCTETIEHLEAPWTVLESIAPRCQYLLLSCPWNEAAAVGNYEHYWSFTLDDVDDLLEQAGFTDRCRWIFSEPEWTYDYQVWLAQGRAE